MLLLDFKNKVRKFFGVIFNFFGMLLGCEIFVFNKDGKFIFKFKFMGVDVYIKEVLKYF